MPHNPVIALSLHRSRSMPYGAAAPPQTAQAMPIITTNIPAGETAAARDVGRRFCEPLVAAFCAVRGAVRGGAAGAGSAALRGPGARWKAQDPPTGRHGGG